MKRILVATDGSRPSREALELGLGLARALRGHVVVAHVAPALDTMPMAGSGMTGALQHRLNAADRAPLAEATELAERYGVLVRAELRQGEPADEIVRLADAVDADLIVVGSRGRGAIAGALLGSVSAAVLHGSKRSVLVVRDGRVGSSKDR